MKKTLITLLALGSMAMGEDVSLFTIKNTTAQQSASTAPGTYTAEVLTKDAAITLTDLEAKAVSVGTTAQLTPTDYTRSMFSVPTNIGNGGSYTFEQDFTVEVLDGATITLTSLDIDFFAHNGNGQKQTVDRGFKGTLTLTKVDETEPLYTSAVTDITITGTQPNYTGAAYNQDGNRVATAGGTTQTFTLTEGVDLSAGNYTLSIKVENLNPSTGTFIGIGHVGAQGTVSQVPEPATGTLSLLALAGLCIRRRKK